jgi:hypothetical protein
MRPVLRRCARRFCSALPATVALVVVAIACERSAPVPGRKDTTIPVVPPPESSLVVTPPTSTWDPSAGPALFVAGQIPSEALVLVPEYSDSTALDSVRFDLSRLRSVRVDLFATGKRLGTAQIDAVNRPTRTDACRGWPRAQLVPATPDSGSLPSWSVAFQAGHAAEVPIDSIEALASPDSARLAADIARIASALPGDTAAMFRGLPFVVTKAWRARLPPNNQVLAAIVVRNVNQEANPRQERLLLVAERDSTTATTRYTPVYSERVTGLEETVETTDLVGMVLLGDERLPTVVVARDTGNGSSYALIERIGGQWRRRWASAYVGC